MSGLARGSYWTQALAKQVQRLPNPARNRQSRTKSTSKPCPASCWQAPRMSFFDNWPNTPVSAPRNINAHRHLQACRLRQAEASRNRIFDNIHGVSQRHEKQRDSSIYWDCAIDYLRWLNALNEALKQPARSAAPGFRTCVSSSCGGMFMEFSPKQLRR